MAKTEKREKQILWLSFGSGVFFVIFEFWMAIYNHSQSVLMDAAYDASELIIIGLTLFLTPLFHKPATEKHPFGYAQVESFFVIIKGFMMLSVTLGLSANSIELALSGGNRVDGGKISFLQLVLGSISLIILLIMMRMNRGISSPIISAEIYGWKLDVFYSLGMSLAFFASTFLEGTVLDGLSPYFDQIVAVLVVLFVLPDALKLLIRAIKDVFLFSPEAEIMENIKSTCNLILSNYCFNPVFYDVTRTGRKMWVSIYFTVEQELLPMPLLKEATQRINQSLLQEFENCSAELIAYEED